MLVCDGYEFLSSLNFIAFSAFWRFMLVCDGFLWSWLLESRHMLLSQRTCWEATQLRFMFPLSANWNHMTMLDNHFSVLLFITRISLLKDGKIYFSLPLQKLGYRVHIRELKTKWLSSIIFSLAFKSFLSASCGAVLSPVSIIVCCSAYNHLTCMNLFYLW